MLASTRRGVLILAAGALALAAPTGATAAEIPGKTWEVGPYVVNSIYDNDSLLSDTVSLGVRGGYFFKPQHGIELTFESQSTDEATQGSDETIDLEKYLFDYVYNFKTKKPDSKLAPLLIFGFGKMAYEGNNSSGTHVSDSTTLIQSGGGVRVMFKPWIAMRVEGKLYHYHGDGVLLPRDPYFGFDIDLGVSFFIGPGN